MTTHTSEYSTIVASVLFARSDAERAQALDGRAPSVLAAAFLDAILEVVHPCSLTLILSDVVRAYVPDEETLTRAIAAISDPHMAIEMRATCLRAISMVDDFDPAVFRDHARMREMYTRWEIAARASPDDWWDHGPTQLEETTAPLVYAQRPSFVPLSEPDTRKIVQEQAHLFHELVDWAFETEELDEVRERFSSREPRFVMDALVHTMIEGSPEHRELCRAFALKLGEPTPLSMTRVRLVAADNKRELDLRAECLMAAILMSPGATLRDLRSTPPLVDVPTREWEPLVDAYHRHFAISSCHVPERFAQAATSLSLAQFEDVCTALRERDCEPDWGALLDDPRLSYLWPRVAEELAHEGAVDMVDRIEACANLVHGAAGRARMLSALIRLRHRR